MLTIQVVPRAGLDAYKLLRDKVTHEAQTWEWANRRYTRLQRKEKTRGIKQGYIEIGNVDGVLVAQIYPRDEDLYYFVEKFVGRLVAWFADDLVAINIQLIEDERPKRRK